MEGKKNRRKKKKPINHIKNLRDFLNATYTIYFLFSLSFIGLVASIAVHIASYKGFSPAYTWILHAGLFAVWIPTIPIIKKISAEKRKTFWEYIKKYTSNALRNTYYLFAVYSIFIFIFSLMNLTGMETPIQQVDKNELNRLELVLVDITEGEFQNRELFELRAFSSFWIIFYFPALIILYAKLVSRNRKKKMSKVKRTHAGGVPLLNMDTATDTPVAH